MSTNSGSLRSVVSGFVGTAVLTLSALAGAALAQVGPHAWIGWTLLGVSGAVCGVVISRLLAALRSAEAQKSEQLAKIDRMLSICCYCKRVEVDVENRPTEWMPVEVYFNVNAGTEFSHGMCPECEQEVFRREFGTEGLQDRPADPPEPRSRKSIPLPAVTSGSLNRDFRY